MNEPQTRILLTAFWRDSAAFLDRLEALLAPVFPVPIEKLPPVQVPPGAFHPGRNQYLADPFLQKLLPLRQKADDHILGVTHLDLYSGNLNFVFGVASAALKTAVISTARLVPEFYGQKPNLALFWKRVLTEAAHELGHTFGLSHCPNPRCVMHFSNSILDTDKKGAQFCPICRQKLEEKLR